VKIHVGSPNCELQCIGIGLKMDGFFCCSLSCIQHVKTSSLTTYETNHVAILSCSALLEGKHRAIVGGAVIVSRISKFSIWNWDLSCIKWFYLCI